MQLKWEKKKIKGRNPQLRKTGMVYLYKYVTTNIEYGGFRINETYNGYSLHRFVSAEYNGVHIGTFNTLKAAQKVAQLIHNKS